MHRKHILTPLKTEPSKSLRSPKYYETDTESRRKSTTSKRLKSESVHITYRNKQIEEQGFSEIREERSNSTQREALLSSLPTKPNHQIFKKNPIWKSYISENRPQQDPRVVEEWISDILIESEAGKVDQTRRREVMSQYGLDKRSLKVYLYCINCQGLGLTLEQINRLYRSMFIYTFGFHKMLQETLENLEERDNILVKYWKVYTILLQYCSKNEYQTVLSLVEKDRTLEINHLKKQLREQQEQSDLMHQQESSMLKSLSNEVTKLKNDNDQLLHEKKQIELTLLVRDDAFNEEVSRRLKFENKLNTIYSVHKEFMLKHKELMDELKDQRMKNDQLVEIHKQKDLSIIHQVEVNHRLSHKLSDVTEEIVKLQQILQQREEALEEIQQEQELLRQANQDNYTQKKNTQTSNEMIQIKYKDSLQRISSMTQEIDQLRIQIVGLKINNQDLSSNFHNSKSLHEKTQLENSELSHRLDVQGEILQEIQSKFQISQIENNDLRSHNHSLQKQLTDLTINYEYLQMLLSQKESIITQLQEAFKSILKEQEKAQATIEAQRLYITNVQAQESQHEQEISMLKNEVTAFALQKSDLEMQLNILANQLSVTQKEDEKLIEQLNSKNITLNHQFLEIVEQNSQLKKKQQLLEADSYKLITKNDQLNTLLDLHNLQMNSKTIQLDTLLRSYSDLERQSELYVQMITRSKTEIFYCQRKLFALCRFLKLASQYIGQQVFDQWIIQTQKQINDNIQVNDPRSRIDIHGVIQVLLEMDEKEIPQEPEQRLQVPKQIEDPTIHSTEKLISQIENVKKQRFNAEKIIEEQRAQLKEAEYATSILRYKIQELELINQNLLTKSQNHDYPITTVNPKEEDCVENLPQNASFHIPFKNQETQRTSFISEKSIKYEMFLKSTNEKFQQQRRQSTLQQLQSLQSINNLQAQFTFDQPLEAVDVVDYNKQIKLELIDEKNDFDNDEDSSDAFAADDIKNELDNFESKEVQKQDLGKSIQETVSMNSQCNNSVPKFQDIIEPQKVSQNQLERLNNQMLRSSLDQSITLQEDVLSIEEVHTEEHIQQKQKDKKAKKTNVRKNMNREQFKRLYKNANTFYQNKSSNLQENTMI